jgi:cellulose 1,4-beta-cellobiosidase
MRYLLACVLLLAGPALAAKTEVTLTAVNQGYYVVSVNGVDVSNHTTERGAIKAAVNFELAKPSDVVEYRHDYRVKVEATVTEPAPEPEPTVLPGPPGMPQLTADPEGVRATWNAGSDATEYLVKWGHSDDTGAGNRIVLETTTVVTLTKEGFVCVTSRNATGVSGEVCAPYGPPSAPPPPPELKADLSWDASSGATGYRLFTGTVPGFGGGAGIDVGNVTSYTASGFTAGTTHYFRVSAYNNTGESKQSSEVSKTF